ncbi:MAG: helix-turn-helix transcriptional regulator [Pseudomonadota bacterium]
MAASSFDASDIDRIVGERIRRRRVLLGLTQDQLADALGISYQQTQKYVTGANRVSAGRLFKIAETLDTKAGWFFDGIGGEDSDRLGDEPLGSSRHTIDLVRSFQRIEDDKQRMAVLSLVRALAGEEGDVAAPVAATPNANGHAEQGTQQRP